jgi:hypothetical protein
MAVRIRHDIKVTISENPSEVNELGKTTPWVGVNDQQENGGSWTQNIAASTVDQLVDMNGLADATFLAIKTNETITIKKNGAGGEAWTIQALGVGSLDGFFVVSTTGVTSIYVSNAGAKDATVTFMVAGTN